MWAQSQYMGSELPLLEVFRESMPASGEERYMDEVG